MTLSIYLKLFAILTAGAVLLSCSSSPYDRYKNYTPEFDVKNFFKGKLQAHGIVKNRGGEVIRYFTADINAYEQDNTIVLEEQFQFNDGEQQTRIWKLKPLENGKYSAKANDVLNETTLSTVGNALFMKYKLEIPYKGKTIAINVDDRMFLVDDTTVINESIFRKFGFKVGSAQLVIKKQSL